MTEDTNDDPLLQYLSDDSTESKQKISRSRDDIPAFKINEERLRCWSLVKEYRRAKSSNKSIKPYKICPDIQCLFDIIRSMYIRDNKESYPEFAKKIYSNDIDIVISALYDIDAYLDSKNITAVDVRQSFAGMGAIDRNEKTKR